MRAQMFFESDCKSRRLSQEVMELHPSTDFAQLVSISLCQSSLDEERKALREQMKAITLKARGIYNFVIPCGLPPTTRI